MADKATTNRPPDTPELRQMLRTYTHEQVAKFNKENGTNYNAKMIEGLIEHESGGYDPYAVSKTGAAGLGQFTIGTAKEYNLSPEDRFNPLKAIPAAIAHFHKGMQAYPDSMTDGIRAYNAGVKGVTDYHAGAYKNDPEREAEIANFPSLVLAKSQKVSGMSAQPQASVNAQPAAATAQPAAYMPAADPAVVAAQAPRFRRARSMPPPSGEEDVTTTQELMSGAAAGAKYIGQTLWDGLTQFPRELGQNLAAPQANEAMREQWPASMGAPPTVQPPPPIDPAGFVNFVTLPLGFGSVARPLLARAGNAVIGGGLSVLNTADAIARRQATTDGLNWEDIPTGDRITRILNQLDTNSFADTLGEGLMPMLLGGAVGAVGRVSEHGFADDVAEIWKPGQRAEREARQAYDLKVAKIQADNERRLGDYQLKVDEADAQHLAATDEAIWAQDEFSSRVTPIEQRVSRAEERTGLRRTPINATDIEKMRARNEARALLRRNYRIPDENPAAPIYARLHETTNRPLDPEILDQVESVFEEIRREAHASGRLGPDMRRLTSRLGDVENLTPQIIRLERRAEAVTNNEARRAQIMAEAEVLRSARPEPTVRDFVDRIQAIDALRRTKQFRDSITPEINAKLADVSRQMRADDGLVQQVLSPEEFALWRQGASVAKDYRSMERTINFISDAFTNVNPGTSIRKKLTGSPKRVENLRRQFGDENFDSILQLADDLEALNMKFPKAPKNATLPDAPRLTPPELRDLPGPFVPPALPTDIKRVSTILRNALTGAGAVSLATTGLHYLQPETSKQEFSLYTHLGGAAIGTLLAIPATRRLFHTFVRGIDGRSGKMTLQAQQALSRMIVARTLADSYGEEVQPADLLVGPPVPPIAQRRANIRKDAKREARRLTGVRVGRVPGQ